MTALTADRQAPYKEGVTVPIPVGALKTIYAGSLVALDGTTRAAEAGSDASGKVFAGIAAMAADNSAGLEGDLDIVVRRKGLHLFNIYTSVTQDDVGKPVFIKDDQTVALAANVTYGIYCGVIAGIESSTEVWVDIYPALLQTDVATHIADTSAAHAASAISTADAGNHFAATTDTVEEQLQALAKGPFFLTLPRFTGWTKDGADHAISLPAIESPVPVVVKRAYVLLGTAPGTGKTLALKLNDTALVSITEGNTAGEAESLAIAIAVDTDFVIKANETASGAGANCDIVLVMYVDDGE